MTDITVQQAVDRIAKELMEMADGAEAAPRIEMYVEWLDVSTIERRAWVPRLSIKAYSEKVISLADL